MTPRNISFLFAIGLVQSALGQSALWENTFTNPAPAAGDNFGVSVAALANDRVIIGAWSDDAGAANAGIAYLLNTKGGILATFTNPAPADNDFFGYSVAAMATEWVFVGAPGDDGGGTDSGSAYMFSTNGTLVTTFNNPAAPDSITFGHSVAAVGSSHVLIGAPGDSTGARQAGAAYLFSTNGILLTTITNPVPAADDWFGQAVAAVGNDRVLVGAYRDDAGATDAGSAYLFSTNGTLHSTFVNPAPELIGGFAVSVAAVGDDRVLIGAYGDIGAAYLFNVDGALLTTLTNPTPASFDGFGISVAAVGSGHLLIGAMFDDAGAANAGAAHLFSTNGTWLATIANPSAADSDWFGAAVTAAGSESVIIGAYQDDTGAADAGAAYLFSLSLPIIPSLTIVPAGTGNSAISWAPISPGFVLQETESLAPRNWTNSPSGAANPTDVPATSPGKYFRLFKP